MTNHTKYAVHLLVSYCLLDVHVPLFFFYWISNLNSWKFHRVSHAEHSLPRLCIIKHPNVTVTTDCTTSTIIYIKSKRPLGCSSLSCIKKPTTIGQIFINSHLKINTLLWLNHPTLFLRLPVLRNLPQSLVVPISKKLIIIKKSLTVV